MSMSSMPTMSLMTNKYRKGEKLVAARAFDLSYGTESIAVAEGTVAKVISETGEPLVVQFKGVEQAVSIPMTDAEKFLHRAPVKEDVDNERMKRTLVLSEGVIAETRFPTVVSESAGRQIKCTNIDGKFTNRPFSLIPGQNLQSLIGKTGEIVFEYMDLGDGDATYKCNFAEAGRVALKASEFEYVEPGKSGSFDNKSESRRLLRPTLTEGLDEGSREALSQHGWKHDSNGGRGATFDHYVHHAHPNHEIQLKHKDGSWLHRISPGMSRVIGAGTSRELHKHLSQFHGKSESFLDEARDKTMGVLKKHGFHQSSSAKHMHWSTHLPGSVEYDPRPNMGSKWTHHQSNFNSTSGFGHDQLDKHLTQIAQTPDKLHYNRGIGTGAVHTRGGKDYESVTDEDFMDEAKCTICHKPIVLSPSAKERARKFGGTASHYTSLFTTHADCAIKKRSGEAHDLMKKIKGEAVTDEAKGDSRGNAHDDSEHTRVGHKFGYKKDRYDAGSAHYRSAGGSSFNVASKGGRWVHYGRSTPGEPDIATGSGENADDLHAHLAKMHGFANESITNEYFMDEAKGPSCWSALSVPCRGKAGEKCNRCGHMIKAKHQDARKAEYKKSTGSDYKD
jgi:hypothetical protein